MPSTPKAVVREIVKDLAATKRGEKGILEKTADKWGVTVAVVEHITKRERKDIMMLREGIAERGLILAAMTDERALECLQDEDRMKATPLRDISRAREGFVNSALVALEGHQQQGININFAFIKEQEKKVLDYDAMLANAKRAKVVEVPAS